MFWWTMVDSVDDLMSSPSIRRRRCPNVEMLDAKTASSLKQIIQNSQFKKRVNLAEQKALVGGQISLWKTDCVH